MLSISDQERREISATISKAEEDTSGEIVAVIADSSDNYTYIPFLVASLAALIVPWPLVHFTWWPVQWIFALQLAIFLLLLMLLWPKAVRIWFVPRATRELNAERRAAEQFLVQNLHTTHGRTGVLLFVSVLESHAVICADTAIDGKVENGTWQKIIDDMTDEFAKDHYAPAFINAILRIGEHLAKHFPPSNVASNELPDHLIVLTD